jgi:hypothetical protein
MDAIFPFCAEAAHNNSSTRLLYPIMSLATFDAIRCACEAVPGPEASFTELSVSVCLLNSVVHDFD